MLIKLKKHQSFCLLPKEYKLQGVNNEFKGKINIANTLKQNIFQGQSHKTVCDYQEFGINCLENRLLKKALKFVQSYLATNNIKTNENLKLILAYCLAPFELVSDEVDIKTIKNFKNNAFFKEYSQGLNLAKMFLKHFAYNFKNTGDSKQTPPFYIDMSLLFEKYVYALLLENNKVKYQVEGHYGTVDFLVNDMVVDTKYKPQYRNKKKDEYDYNIDDIRQLSGYGRDRKIREKLNLGKEIAKCLIIYPLKDGKSELGDLWNNASDISQFKNFRKIGVKLPQFNV